MERLKLKLQEVCESIVSKQFNELKKMATSLGMPPDNFQLVSDLNEVLNYPPFDQIINQQSSLRPNLPVIFCDFDGVISNPWNNNDDSNLRRLLALKTIICHSSEFYLWTMRVPVDDDNSLLWRNFLAKHFDRGPIARFPFVTNTNLRRLYNFFQNAYQSKNKQTPQEVKNFDQYSIYLHPGNNKILGPENNPFFEAAIRVLESVSPLVIIGSSEFDRNQVREMLEKVKKNPVDLNNLYYFDTGHLIL